MKNIFLFIGFNFIMIAFIYAQETTTQNKHEREIYSLIDQYVHARENMDTVLLNRILTTDVDQLVSSGEWRQGIGGATKGMLRSSESNPGARSINVEKIRFLNPETAITDARYEIQNTNGTSRKMWSTFIVVYQEDRWKITAIRNMLPAGQR